MSHIVDLDMVQTTAEAAQAGLTSPPDHLWPTPGGKRSPPGGIFCCSSPVPALYSRQAGLDVGSHFSSMCRPGGAAGRLRTEPLSFFFCDGPHATGAVFCLYGRNRDENACQAERSLLYAWPFGTKPDQFSLSA